MPWLYARAISATCAEGSLLEVISIQVPASSTTAMRISVPAWIARRKLERSRVDDGRNKPMHPVGIPLPKRNRIGQNVFRQTGARVISRTSRLTLGWNQTKYTQPTVNMRPDTNSLMATERSGGLIWAVTGISGSFRGSQSSKG